MRNMEMDDPLLQDDLYIIAIARAAIAQLGDDAAALLRSRADEHASAGEMEGAEFWRRIADAVAELQNTRST
jgi:hypothetical protein